MEKPTTKYQNTSEKALERYLCRRVKDLGGLCLKYSNAVETGYPDRIVILDGRYLWVELKTTGKLPTRVQTLRHIALQRHGAVVAVCDSRERIDMALHTLLTTFAV